MNTSVLFNKVDSLLFYITDWLFPLTKVSEILFPYEKTTMPDGSGGLIFVTTISYFRTTLTEFLDILFYIIIAVIIGKWISRKKRGVQQI